MSPSDRNIRIAEMKREGTKTQAIANYMGISRCRVEQILKKLGVASSNYEERNANIVGMWIAGSSIEDITQAFAMSDYYIRQILRSNGYSTLKSRRIREQL